MADETFETEIKYRITAEEDLRALDSAATKIRAADAMASAGGMGTASGALRKTMAQTTQAFKDAQQPITQWNYAQAAAAAATSAHEVKVGLLFKTAQKLSKSLPGLGFAFRGLTHPIVAMAAGMAFLTKRVAEASKEIDELLKPRDWRMAIPSARNIEDIGKAVERIKETALDPLKEIGDRFEKVRATLKEIQDLGVQPPAGKPGFPQPRFKTQQEVLEDERRAVQAETEKAASEMNQTNKDRRALAEKIGAAQKEAADAETDRAKTAEKVEALNKPPGTWWQESKRWIADKAMWALAPGTAMKRAQEESQTRAALPTATRRARAARGALAPLLHEWERRFPGISPEPLALGTIESAEQTAAGNRYAAGLNRLSELSNLQQGLPAAGIGPSEVMWQGPIPTRAVYQSNEYARQTLNQRLTRQTTAREQDVATVERLRRDMGTAESESLDQIEATYRAMIEVIKQRDKRIKQLESQISNMRE